MKNKAYIKSLLCVILFLFFTSNKSFSQVTIGSNQEPVAGSILDLKENKPDGQNITSNRGLGMPRVLLTDMKNLYPMFSGDTDYENNVNNKRDEENSKHVGLVVYNTNVCANPNSADAEGLYVWSGSEWMSLMSSESGIAPEVEVYRDQENKPFMARKFGDAGVWMLQNLDVRKYADETPLPPPGMVFESWTAEWVYPGVDTNGTDDRWYVANPTLGLLYNSWAAVRTVPNGSVDRGQEPTDTPGPNEVESTATFDGPDSNGYYYIQGICPNGWHVPSDREWNKLEKEIYNNPEKYSQYTTDNGHPFDPIEWDDDWDIHVNTDGSGPVLRGSTNGEGHNKAMIAPCQPTWDAQLYKSKPISKGGFFITLAGITNVHRITKQMYEFGRMFSSSQNGSAFYSRTFHKEKGGVERVLTVRTATNSIRCKKND